MSRRETSTRRLSLRTRRRPRRGATKGRQGRCDPRGRQAGRGRRRPGARAPSRRCRAPGTAGTVSTGRRVGRLRAGAGRARRGRLGRGELPERGRRLLGGSLLTENWVLYSHESWCRRRARVEQSRRAKAQAASNTTAEATTTTAPASRRTGTTGDDAAISPQYAWSWKTPHPPKRSVRVPAKLAASKTLGIDRNRQAAV